MDKILHLLFLAFNLTRYLHVQIKVYSFPGVKNVDGFRPSVASTQLENTSSSERTKLSSKKPLSWIPLAGSLFLEGLSPWPNGSCCCWWTATIHSDASKSLALETQNLWTYDDPCSNCNGPTCWMRTRIETAGDGVPKNKKPGKSKLATEAKMKHSANLCVSEGEREEKQINNRLAYLIAHIHPAIGEHGSVS